MFQNAEKCSKWLSSRHGTIKFRKMGKGVGAGHGIELIKSLLEAGQCEVEVGCLIKRSKNSCEQIQYSISTQAEQLIRSSGL